MLPTYLIEETIISVFIILKMKKKKRRRKKEESLFCYFPPQKMNGASDMNVTEWVCGEGEESLYPHRSNQPAHWPPALPGQWMWDVGVRCSRLAGSKYLLQTHRPGMPAAQRDNVNPLSKTVQLQASVLPGWIKHQIQSKSEWIISQALQSESQYILTRQIMCCRWTQT